MEILTIHDVEKVKPYLEKADYKEYNSNIVTMMMWQFSYPITYEIKEHYAIVKWHFKEGCSFMMPLCEKTYWKEAMDDMRSYCAKEHGRFSIASATQEFKQWCEETYPDEFLYEDLVDAQDYVYLSEPHRTLSGKKMQKRRNHYNAFLKEYDQRFEYKSLKELTNEEILSYLDIWNEHHEASRSLISEKKGIKFLLQHQDVLKLMGGGLYIDGELKAFLIASALSSDTLEIHVEKADKEIRGLYIAMLKHFLMHQDEKYTYINREDDMGLEHLRTAKMNMKPAYKIKKYGIYLNDITIRKAETNDIEQIKALWLDSFQEETPKTTQFYFEHLFHFEDCYVIEHEKEILTMLQCRKVSLMINGKKQDTSFIVGVATKASYRHNGLMKKLLNHVLAILQTQEPFTILQAYDWNLYKPFGFKETHYHQYAKPQAYPMRDLVIQECTDTHILLSIYNKYCENKNGYRIRDEQYYDTYLLPYTALEDGHIYVAYENEKPIGSMIVQGTVCSEYLPLNETAHHGMQNFLYLQNPDIRIWADDALQFKQQEDRVPCLMMLFHQDMKVEEPLFINEFL